MDPERFTAAHRSYPFGTVVRVDDLETGRSVVVTINDRGPFVEGRIIDLSYASARALGILQRGVARVRIQVIGESTPDATPFTWRVQVGAFSDVALAENLAEIFRQKRYFPVIVYEQKEKNGTYFKVWLGQFNWRQDADDLANRLRQEGQSAIVISTKKDI
jgi:rare lipoprotein A